MMNSIVVMVVQTIASLLAGMCLLRAYMLWLGLRVGLGNSAGAYEGEQKASSGVGAAHVQPRWHNGRL